MKQKTTIATILLIIAVVFLLPQLHSQSTQNKCDTVIIIAPAFLVLNDTSIHLHTDTTAIICNKYIVLTKKNGYNLYSKLSSESRKHHMVDRLFQMLIASSSQDTMLAKKAIMNAEDAYVPYSGKIIRSIRIQTLDPFGASISDTNLPVISPWGKALNKSHINTHKKVLERKLLFKLNDTINPFELVENTKILTDLSYLQDATIIVSNATPDSVDVLILAKDKFPWIATVQQISLHKSSGYIRNANIIGLGQSLGAGLQFDSKSTPNLYVSEVNYYIDNMYKQISAAVNYKVSDNDQTYQIKLNRDIIPLSVRLGGGLELSQFQENIVIDPTFVNENAYYFKYNYFHLWNSYLFYEKTNDRKKHKHAYIIPSTAIYKRQYLYRPFVSIDSNSTYVNYTNLLGSLAFAKQDYFRTNYITSFGKAEYLPHGFQFSITGGYTWSEFNNLPYFGAKVISTTYFEKVGYIVTNINIGSHFTDKLEQGAINVDLSLLTSLVTKNRYRYRALVSVKYTTAINRITNDMIYLGDNYGFIGMSNHAWYGKQRLFLEIDFITYTPWYFLGFRFAIFSFGSIGLIGPDQYSIFHNQILSSVGVGLYVKNDFLDFSSFQIRAAYFPVTPEGISHFGITFTSFGLIKSLNMLINKPQIVEFR